jgi:hypothetical protein
MVHSFDVRQSSEKFVVKASLKTRMEHSIPVALFFSKQVTARPILDPLMTLFDNMLDPFQRDIVKVLQQIKNYSFSDVNLKEGIVDAYPTSVACKPDFEGFEIASFSIPFRISEWGAAILVPVLKGISAIEFVHLTICFVLYGTR